MGGTGSGRWKLHIKKLVAENCLKLAIKALRTNGGQSLFHQPEASGVIRWGRGIAAEYSIHAADQVLQLSLAYQFPQNGASVLKTPTISISTTHCTYGGQRHWFHCPVCQRRSSILYLRNGEFACRQCHDLTYTSSQTAHQAETLARRLDRLRRRSNPVLQSPYKHP